MRLLSDTRCWIITIFNALIAIAFKDSYSLFSLYEIRHMSIRVNTTPFVSHPRSKSTPPAKKCQLKWMTFNLAIDNTNKSLHDRNKEWLHHFNALIRNIISIEKRRAEVSIPPKSVVQLAKKLLRIRSFVKLALLRVGNVKIATRIEKASRHK